jgi:hypothetical protein
MEKRIEKTQIIGGFMCLSPQDISDFVKKAIERSFRDSKQEEHIISCGFLNGFNITI